MSMTCTVCKSEQRENVEKALLRGESERSIAKQTPGLSHAAIHRHRAHIPPAVAEAAHDEAVARTVAVIGDAAEHAAELRRLGRDLEEVDGDRRGAVVAVKASADIAAKIAPTGAGAGDAARFAHAFGIVREVLEDRFPGALAAVLEALSRRLGIAAPAAASRALPAAHEADDVEVEPVGSRP